MNTALSYEIQGRTFHARTLPGKWQQSIATCQAFGLSLAQSRIDLTPQEWRAFVLDDCPFDLTVACRIIKLTQGQQVPGVPARSYRFYDLVRLEEPIFRYGMEQNRIWPTCSSDELAALKRDFKASASETARGGRQLFENQEEE